MFSPTLEFLFGVLVIVFGILFSSKDIKTNSLLIFGYLIVWAACLYHIFKLVKRPLIVLLNEKYLQLIPPI